MTKPRGKNKRKGSVNPKTKPAPNSQYARNAINNVYYRNKLDRKE